MHELSIGQGLLAQALVEANKRHAKHIAAVYFSYSTDLELSHLECSFRMVSQGTIAEGSQLCARADGGGGGMARLEGLDVEEDNGPLTTQLSAPGD